MKSISHSFLSLAHDQLRKKYLEQVAIQAELDLLRPYRKVLVELTVIELAIKSSI
jgi:hypothetical protein